MVKNKQFTSNMKKATLITLSAGVGASAIIPGMGLGSPLIEAHASEVAIPGLPAEGADFLTEMGDVSNYNFLNGPIMSYYNGLEWIEAWLPNYYQDVKEIDGVLYATTKPYTRNSGEIHRYNETTRAWETVGSTGNAIYDIVGTGNGGLVTGGGVAGSWGDYYSLYSSVGGDSNWETKMNAYHSKSNYGYNTTGGGLFKTGVEAEGVTYMFGETYKWTNIQTTTDGETFEPGARLYGNYHEAIYAGGKIVAIGEQDAISKYGSIAVAEPGGAFTVHKVGVYTSFNDIAYGNDTFVIVGNDMQGNAAIYTSQDGSAWTRSTAPSGDRILKGIAYDEANGRFVAVGQSGVIMSVDGKEWVKISNLGTSYTGIVIKDNEVNEYDTALFELSKVTTAINAADYKVLENTTSLQESLDSVVENEVNAVVNETQKEMLMEQVEENQERLDSLEIAIDKYIELKILIDEEAQLINPTPDEIVALRSKVSAFSNTLTDITNSSIRSSFTNGSVATLLESLKVKEAEIFVSRAEESYTRADYNEAYPYASGLKYGSTERTEMLDRLSVVSAGIPVREATLGVEIAEETLKESDYNFAKSKVNVLPYGSEKDELNDRLQMAHLERLEADFVLVMEGRNYDTVVMFGSKINQINSDREDIVAKKAELQAKYDAFKDAFFTDKFNLYLDEYIPQYGYNSAYHSGAIQYYTRVSNETRSELQNDFYVIAQMNSNQDVTNAVMSAARNYTGDTDPAYLDAIEKVETISSSNYMLKEYLTNVLAELGTVTATLSQDGTDVVVAYESIEEGTVSFEVLRDGEVIYTGTELSYRDAGTTGATTHEYTVNALDENGETIANKTKTITTPSYTEFNGESVSGNVELEMSYQKDEDVTFEIIRNEEVVFEGADGKFVDNEVEGASEITYKVNVKNENGTVVGMKEITVNTAINNPTGARAEETSETSTLITWGEDNNPDSTEYLVEAKPAGDFEAKPVTTVEDFESSTPVLPRTGNWLQSALAKKDGDYGLKSATIGHRGTTTSTYTIDVPATITDGKVSFDYRVSSEQNYDWFRVVLNGTQIVRESGNGSWKNIERNLKPGKNTLVFEYKKDGSASRYSDAAFIDNLTATTADDGIKTSGWITSHDYEFSGLLEGIEYEYTLVAKANGLQSDTVVVDTNNPVDEAKDALASIVEDLENRDLTDLEEIADVQEKLDAVKELTEALPAGIEKEEIIAELNDLQELLDDAKVLAEATQAVDSFIDALPEELTTQVAIDEATAGLNEVQEIVESLVDSEEKTALIERLENVQETIELAQNVLNANEAVAELSETVATLETQEVIDEALALLEDAKDLVALLPVDNSTRVELEKELAKAQEAIELAQKVLNAKEAVTDLKESVATLETQEAIDLSQTLLETAISLVSLLPAENTVRVELEKELAEAKEAIELAQAELDVAKLADAPTQEEIDKARESVEKLKDGAVKDALVEKIELAQDVLDTKTLLEEIATREINTTEEVDQAIADLESADELIASLEGTFMNGEKSVLEQAHQEAKKHIADEFLALLEDNKNQKGKKEKLSISDKALNLLVQQLVAENPAITKGDLKGQLQPLLASSVTGKTLNDVIAVYVN